VASEWAFLEAELTDMRYLLTPTIATLMEQVKREAPLSLVCYDVRSKQAASTLRQKNVCWS
jgi:hypothetical protein